MDVIEVLNNIYEPICMIKTNLQNKLKTQSLEFSTGYYNNHTIKDGKGNWITEFYPIPVITVGSLCDIGIDVNLIFVETKMERSKAIKFNYSSLLPCKFEVYGIDEYLLDFYNEFMDVKDIGEKIGHSNEKQVGINFTFMKDCSIDDIILLINKLISFDTFTI
jgi:hypothetical protein